MAPKTSTFFDLKTCLGKSYRHSRVACDVLSGFAQKLQCLVLVPTSLFHSGQRSPRSLAGPTSGEELLKGSWEDSKMDCDGTFHMFHQVLGWSSCLRSPTDRHAVVRPGWIVSPDSLCHLWSYYSSIITTSIALSIRTKFSFFCFYSHYNVLYYSFFLRE